MSRLTTNKPVDEMSMLELAYNSCYAENGKAMYRDFETVKDVRDFVREANVYLLDSVLPADDDEFDEIMIDDLQYNPTIYVRGLIALFYRNLWAMADFREALKAYEDKQEQGLLIDVPCKIGDKAWVIDDDYEYPKKKKVYEAKWIRVSLVQTKLNNSFELRGEVSYQVYDCFYNDGRTMLHGMYVGQESTKVGEIVFLTQSEAEEALAKMGGKA